MLRWTNFTPEKFHHLDIDFSNNDKGPHTKLNLKNQDFIDSILDYMIQRNLKIFNEINLKTD